LRHAYL